MGLSWESLDRGEARAGNRVPHVQLAGIFPGLDGARRAVGQCEARDRYHLASVPFERGDVRASERVHHA